MKHLLPHIPKIDDCIHLLTQLPVLEHIPLSRLKFLIRSYINRLRQQILQGHNPGPLSLDDNGILPDLVSYIITRHRPRLRRVLNATGVIIHTNLGRSLLPAASSDALYSAASRYNNLELQLETGKRGSRYQLVEDILCEITGGEAALVVNNNAAAVFLALETIARGKEVVVSRGQLVEIGGSFRIPEVMKRSGARLVEIGTTNRTHLQDYESAITAETGLLLRVHCSNYRIIGFTCEVANEALVTLGKKYGVPVVEDLGSGSFVDTSQFGLEKEPTVQEVLASGVDVVTFSGDKLLGGPQAGLIVGKKEYIEQIKRNPLNRALRIDKCTLAALESVLRCYLDMDQAIKEIPTLNMIAASLEEVETKARSCLEQIKYHCTGLCHLEVADVSSRVGGGAMPEQNIPSKALALRPLTIKASSLEKLLRTQDIPVIGRVENQTLFFDMRTVGHDEVEILAETLVRVITGEKQGEEP
ncbi:MAG: L-seryl-tRNA(Sec) selenium transferase [Desulfobulbus propionicus]|nr:MAG: L-seryl-tRNA(Sec) selenium transferase [Desulfobulbus propionicus]